MKISHRILILILINIVALVGMAGIIFHLGQTEQEYYEQSNTLLHVKSLLIKKQYMEKLILNDAPVFGDPDRLQMEVDRYCSLIDRDLLKNTRNLYDELETAISGRQELSDAVMKIHWEYRSRKTEILNMENDLLLLTDEIIDSIEKKTELSGQERKDYADTYSVGKELAYDIREARLLNAADWYGSDRLEHTAAAFGSELEKLQALAIPEGLNYSVRILTTSVRRLLDLITDFISFDSASRDIRNEQIVELYKTDDEILLMIDNIINELHNSISIRESQEQYTIISGILIIVLLSIWATAFLGRSISRPIESLRSYVHSIDLSNIRDNRDRTQIQNIDSRRHLEIFQLAESYADLEEALFQKMEELEERSDRLSLELKERKRTEKKLKQTEKYLNNIIQSLQSLIITVDSDLNLIHWNKEADRISEGEGCDLYSRFPALKSFEKEIAAIREEGLPWADNSIRLDSFKDRYFNISLTPLAGRNSGGIVIRLDDITKMRNIETQLLETQKWETLGVLTSGFAHDFNNVLTGIVTSSSILLHLAERNYPDLDKTFTDCLGIIDRSGNRAAAMVQQLLSLSRSNELTFTNIDLRRSIEDVRSICGNSFDKSVNFITDLPSEKVIVKADNAQIEQIFLNLCINSYHAMTDMRDKKDAKGGELKVAIKKIFIDEYSVFTDKGYAPGHYAAVSISDQGVGIPEEQRKKIFDPFFTTKEKSKGTGLGLTMVQHIINQHKGFLELYSEPSRGTVMTVYLPLSADESGEEEERPAGRELIKGKGTVLVIDDEEILRVLTESILKECGYTVLVAVDGYNGVDIYREKGASVDLVILDMSMPGISGKETFIELKQINPEQKILLASGFIKDDRIQDLLNLGLEDFIQKPFDFIELSEKVSRIIKSGA